MNYVIVSIYRAINKTNVNDVNFTPFKYQLRPSLPVKKDGQGKAIIVILSALVGGMVACGGVLLLPCDGIQKTGCHDGRPLLV